MDTITWFFLESPVALGIVCATVCAGLLVSWRRSGSAKGRRAFLVSIGVSLALLILQALVVTDHERAVSLMHDLAEAAERPDLERIGAAIDESYQDGRDNRGALLARIHDRLTRYGVQRASLSAFEFQANGDEATVSFRVVCDIRDGDNVMNYMPSRWEVGLVRRGHEWRVRSIRDLQIGPLKTTRTGPPGW